MAMLSPTCEDHIHDRPLQACTLRAEVRKNSELPGRTHSQLYMNALCVFTKGSRLCQKSLAAKATCMSCVL